MNFRIAFEKLQQEDSKTKNFKLGPGFFSELFKRISLKGGFHDEIADESNIQ